MGKTYKNFFNKLNNSIPLIILFYLCFSDVNTEFQHLHFLSFNLQYVLVYYWVLKNPKIFGYGFIFLAGVINDVVLGLPMGVSSLSYLTIASVAAYIRVVTVRASLASDWIAFIPAVLTSNAVYIIALSIFSNLTINYIKNLAWLMFEILNNYTQINKNA